MAILEVPDPLSSIWNGALARWLVYALQCINRYMDELARSLVPPLEVISPIQPNNSIDGMSTPGENTCPSGMHTSSASTPFSPLAGLFELHRVAGGFFSTPATESLTEPLQTYDVTGGSEDITSTAGEHTRMLWSSLPSPAFGYGQLVVFVLVLSVGLFITGRRPVHHGNNLGEEVLYYGPNGLTEAAPDPIKPTNVSVSSATQSNGPNQPCDTDINASTRGEASSGKPDVSATTALSSVEGQKGRNTPRTSGYAIDSSSHVGSKAGPKRTEQMSSQEPRSLNCQAGTGKENTRPGIAVLEVQTANLKRADSSAPAKSCTTRNSMGHSIVYKKTQSVESLRMIFEAQQPSSRPDAAVKPILRPVESNLSAKNIAKGPLRTSEEHKAEFTPTLDDIAVFPSLITQVASVECTSEVQSEPRTTGSGNAKIEMSAHSPQLDNIPSQAPLKRRRSLLPVPRARSLAA